MMNIVAQKRYDSAMTVDELVTILDGFAPDVKVMFTWEGIHTTGSKDEIRYAKYFDKDIVEIYVDQH